MGLRIAPASDFLRSKMSDAIISVENVSKRYVIGHQRGKGDGLRHALEATVRSPLRWLRDRKQARSAQ